MWLFCVLLSWIKNSERGLKYLCSLWIIHYATFSLLRNNIPPPPTLCVFVHFFIQESGIYSEGVWCVWFIIVHVHINICINYLCPCALINPVLLLHVLVHVCSCFCLHDCTHGCLSSSPLLTLHAYYNPQRILKLRSVMSRCQRLILKSSADM